MISSGAIFGRARVRVGFLLAAVGSCICLVLTAPVFAQNSVTVDESLDYIPAGHWQLSLVVGHGELQSPLSDAGHIELSALPSIKYYGKRFYLENTSLGYSLYESPRFAVDLVGRLNSDGLFFPDSGNYLIQSFATVSRFRSVDEKRTDMIKPPKRRLSYLGGAAMHWLGPVNISLAAYRDISGVHDGNEVAVTTGKRLGFGAIEVGFELGATYQSRALVDYYYGADTIFPWMVEPTPVYHPGAALNSYFKLESYYQLTEKVSLLATGRLDRLDEEIWQSPFVIRRETHSFYVGLQYSL